MTNRYKLLLSKNNDLFYLITILWSFSIIKERPRVMQDCLRGVREMVVQDSIKGNAPFELYSYSYYYIETDKISYTILHSLLLTVRDCSRHV